MPFNYKEEYKRYQRYYQSLQPTTPAKRAYTSIIFSFLVISLFGWYAIRPTMQTILTLKREISDKTEVNKKMEDKISALIEAQAAYQEIEPNLPILDEALPMMSEAPRAAWQLSALASATQVAITNISIADVPITGETGPSGQQKPASNTPANFPISLIVTGAYSDVKQFIQGILNLRRTIQIDSIQITPIRESEFSATDSVTPTGTQVTVGLKLNVFYLSL